MLRQLGADEEGAMVIANKNHVGVIQIGPRRAESKATAEARRSRHNIVGVPSKYEFCTSISSVNSKALARVCRKGRGLDQSARLQLENVACDTAEVRSILQCSSSGKPIRNAGVTNRATLYEHDDDSDLLEKCSSSEDFPVEHDHADLSITELSASVTTSPRSALKPSALPTRKTKVLNWIPSRHLSQSFSSKDSREANTDEISNVRENTFKYVVKASRAFGRKLRTRFSNLRRW